MTDSVPTPQQALPPEPVAAPAKKGLAITALVLGIVAILGSWIPFLSIGSIIIGLIGLVFGIIAVILAASKKAAGLVMAIVGGGLSLLAIIFGFISTAVGVAAVGDAIDDLTTSPIATVIPNDDADADVDGAGDPADDETIATAGSLQSPAAIGDGTVWTFELEGDAWDITFDRIDVVEGYSGKVAVVTGTATPTAISNGDMSNWATFPMIEWIADGTVVDDTFDIPMGDDYADYRSLLDLEAMPGTSMKFYSTVGLPDGVVPDYVTAQPLLSDQIVYFATGLAK